MNLGREYKKPNLHPPLLYITAKHDDKNNHSYQRKMIDSK
jgi:hypothetical protein